MPLERSLAKSPVYLKMRMKVSFWRVLFSFFFTSPIFSATLFTKSSSLTSVMSISSILVMWSSAEACFSSTELSRKVIASRSLARSICTAFLVPCTLKVSFSSLSPSTVVFRALRTVSLFSSIWVAMEYSMISMLASWSPSLLVITPIIDLTLRSSSMKERSLTCLMSLLCSMAAQKSMGAAFLKLSQKVWSSHSLIRFSSTCSGGWGTPPGMPVVFTSSSASPSFFSSLSLSLSVCCFRDWVAAFFNIFI
mmetsp:Transcript_39040/g.59463  ORF Transcript_39040/g.59463 Transcript_39040/m.59463 type:complete len:251 (+) Transcript_39040:281-1033(+)